MLQLDPGLDPTEICISQQSQQSKASPVFFILLLSYYVTLLTLAVLVQQLMPSYSTPLQYAYIVRNLCDEISGYYITIVYCNKMDKNKGEI